MSTLSIDEALEALKNAEKGGPNTNYYIHRAQERLREVRQYIVSIEDANAAMMDNIRKSRGHKA